MSLRSVEFEAVGGTWHGLLFDNPATGYPLTLTWAFHVDFREIDTDAGRVTPALDIDWVPLGVEGWRSMTWASAQCQRFAHPIEASVYVFSHHRFEAVDLKVQEQEQHDVRLTACVSGDLDGVGIDRLDIDGWLSFGGIYVQASELSDDLDAAASLLAKCTDVTGLVGETRSHHHLFRPDATPT